MIDIGQEYIIGIAIGTLRLITGILFLFQGIDKAFRLRDHELLAIVPGTVSHHVPGKTSVLLIRTGAWLELIGGILLVAGLFVQPALILLAVDLIVVTIAFSLANPVWDMRHVFPRLVMVIFLLLTPAEADIFSADHLIRSTP